MKILFVCLGNICRSPIAHGLLQHHVLAHKLDWEIDSAGTSDWHTGELPHEKSIAVMQQHGIDIRYQHSRLLVAADLTYFDKVYVMDSDNYNVVAALAKSTTEQEKIELIMNTVTPAKNQAVPDPWGLPLEKYEAVYQMLKASTDAIFKQFS